MKFFTETFPDCRVEKKALMDDCPSKDVYHQLQSLSKHNPCFVQSLQSIMSQNILAEESPDSAAPPDLLSSNQAVLALLLAAHLKPSQGPQQGAASLTSLMKQLEAGTSAVELLKTALAAGSSGQRSGLLPSPGPAPSQPPAPAATPGPQDLSGLISSMTSLVSQGKLPAKAPASLGPATKNPQLMNMLYSAFQVRSGGSVVRGESRFVFQARVTKQHKEVEGEGQPGGENLEAPAPAPAPAGPPPSPGPCYTLASPYCPVYPGGQYPPPPPPGPGQTQSKNLTQILALPPPPPPPASAYSEPGWQVVTQPGQGLLFSPVLAPQVWPPPHHHHHHHQALYLPTTQKRKMEEYLPAQVSNYSDVENQTSKRQKV